MSDDAALIGKFNELGLRPSNFNVVADPHSPIYFCLVGITHHFVINSRAQSVKVERPHKPRARAGANSI